LPGGQNAGIFVGNKYHVNVVPLKSVQKAAVKDDVEED
jgi:hypothetical protein